MSDKKNKFKRSKNTIPINPMQEDLKKMAGLSGTVIRGGQKFYRAIRGTSKKSNKPSSSLKQKDAETNPINKKFQGRFFFSAGAKETKNRQGAVKAAKSFAKAFPKEERVITETLMTPREYKVAKRMFAKFRPRKSPFHPPSQRQGSYGRLIIPKSAKLRETVNKKLTKEVRKEKNGGMIIGKQKDYIKDLM